MERAKEMSMPMLSLAEPQLNTTVWSYEMHIARNATLDIYGYAPTYPYGDEHVIKGYLETSFNRSYCEQGRGDTTLFQTTVYMLYISIFVIALLGNGVVCYIVYASPRMKTVTNYFIVNLAVGDILMSLFCVPFSFFSILLLQYWPFGSVLCHLVNYSQAISVLVSAYTLVAISIDRYIAILWPLRPRISKR